MHASHRLQMFPQRPLDPSGQQASPVLAALAIAHGDGISRKIEILDPQTQGLHQAQATAIHQLRHQLVHPIHAIQHLPHLRLCHHHRQPSLLPGPHHPLQFQIPAQQLLVEKQQGRQGLILGGCTHLSLHRQVGEKGIDLRATHLPGMPQAMKAQEPSQPLLIGCHRAPSIVPYLHLLSVALDKARWPGITGHWQSRSTLTQYSPPQTATPATQQGSCAALMDNNQRMHLRN